MISEEREASDNSRKLFRKQQDISTSNEKYKDPQPKGCLRGMRAEGEESSQEEPFPRLFFRLVFSGRVSCLGTREFKEGGKKQR